MKTLILSLFTILFLITAAYAQEEAFPCETDQINSTVFIENPVLQNHINQKRLELEQFTQNYVQNSILEKSEEVYIIPIVFHIIHDGGPGNISEEQIKDGVRLINEQFRKLNADTTQIESEFKHLAADVKVEFRLAKKDPEGNCTNGINRIYSPLTNTGGHVIKDLIQWPPNQYLNIWVANHVGTSLAGHCLMPPVADTIPEWDGIAIQHSYIGAIGTSDHPRRTVLTHEIGHYLNLYHIWGGNNVPDFYYLPVGQAVNCEHDDMVEDTPNTIGWSTCNLNANSCGEKDMVQNYMDYSYCHLLFTEGQKQRMRAALNSPVAGRNNLWTEENHIATGILEDYQPLCEVNITTSRKLICVGESVTFSDISYHGVSQREWTFEGANIGSASDSTVTVQFNEVGKYSVQLVISNGNESKDSTFLEYIEVLPAENLSDVLIESFESEDDFEQRWRQIPNENPTQFQRYNLGKNSDFSLFADNFNSLDKAEFEIQTVGIDTRNMSKLAIAFDYAYAKASTSNNERLVIFFSKDCGETWQQKGQLSLFNNYSLETDEAFFPTENDWLYREMEINLNNFKEENLLIKFKFITNIGNNLFLDNINICDVDALSVGNELLDSQLQIFPNPAREQLTVQLGQKERNGKVLLYDLIGNIVVEEDVKHSSEITLPINHLKAGSYFLKYIDEKGVESYRAKKVVVK